MSKQLTAVALLVLMAGTAMATPRESQTNAGPVNVWGDSNTPESFTLNFNGSDVGGAYLATHLIFTATYTSNQAGTWPNDMLVDIMAPDGTAVTSRLSETIFDTPVTEAINRTISLPNAANPTAGAWSFTVYEDFEDGDGSSPESILSDITVTLDDSLPATNTSVDSAEDLGALADGPTISRTVNIPFAGVVWYKWTSLDTSAASGRKLTLSTEASSGGDTEIGCFSNDGTLVASVDDFGGTLLSRLSFGAGGLDGDLPGEGVYYAAVGTFNVDFASPFSAVSDGDGGTFQFDVTQAFIGDPRPAADDLGTLVDGVVVSRDIVVPFHDVVWLKADVADCSAAAGRSLTLSTLESSGGDSMIALYDNDGNGIVYADQSNGTDLTELVMGRGGFGDLTAGTYYFAVTTYPTTFYIASWNVVSTGPGSPFHFTVLQTNSFPAEVVGAARSSGSGQLLTVAVTPAVNPDSTGMTVVGDLSEVGGGASVSFHDDGLNGDITAGDNIFSLFVANPAGISDGQAYNVNFTFNDQQSHTLPGSIAFSVDANNSLTTAEVPSGSGPLDSLSGTFDYTGDVDVYRISICDFSNFSASTLGLTTIDTRLWLFNDNGTGVTLNDDAVGDPNFALQSTITSQFVSQNGNYYLAISRYPVVALDASGQEIWNPDDEFRSENAPSGPGAANALGGWVGDAFDDTGEYSIALTGACYPTTNTQCSPADVGIAGGLAGHDHLLNNNDFIAFITLFFANDPQADMGVAGGVPGSDGLWNNNDFIAFISHFFNDSAACNG